VLYASLLDVADEWGPIPSGSEEEARIGRWVEKASLIIDTDVPSVTSRIASGALAPALVRMIVVDMVIRRLNNPTGARTLTTTTGPFMSVRSYGDSAREGLYLTDDERSRLSPERFGRRAFAVDLTPAG
jgi:hypothetical protein